MKLFRQSLFLLNVIAVIAVMSSAEDLYSQKVNFGFKAGPDVSGISAGEFNPYFREESRLGFGIFGFCDLLNNKYISAGAEAGFIQKGFKYSIISFDDSGEINTDNSVSTGFNYLDLSVYIKFIYRQKGVSPFFSLTPVAGVYLGYTQTSEVPLDSIGVITNNYIFDSLKTVSFGIKFGIGAEFNKLIKNMPVLFEIRYYPDFIFSYNKYSVQMKNRVIEFNAGIKF